MARQQDCGMNDLQINAACAVAMGIHHNVKPLRGKVLRCYYMSGNRELMYDPLHDDAQAMAMFKKFNLEIDKENSVNSRGMVNFNYRHNNLNRAICECVATMEKESQ